MNEKRLVLIESIVSALKHDPQLFFRYHKIFIDNYYKPANEYFRKKFGTGEEFKENAKKYLKERGLID